MCSKLTACSFTALAVLTAASSAHATIYEDFKFDDANGTLLAATVNSANPGNIWFEDNIDMSPSAVLDGSYHINKANLDLGHNYLDIDDITTGVRWMVMDIAGWNLVPDVEPEEVFLSFLDNTSIPGGSTRTADINFQMFIPGVFRLQGTALGAGSSSTATLDFGNTRTTPLSVALKLDKDNNTYELLYKDNTDPWASLGTGNVGLKLDESGPREGNTVRFRANNDFGAAGEFFDVDRIYITDVDPTTAVQLEGDLNEDGFVGIADLNIVLGDWNNGTGGAGPIGDGRADPTGDNFVGIGDLNVVQGNWNAGTPPAASAVPEPTSLALLGLGLSAALRRRR